MSTIPQIPDHEMLRIIGRGAYGEVWLARNVMGIMRAVKIVSRKAFDNDRPFQREFAAVKRYEPVSRGAIGLVNVLHGGRDPDHQLFYYIMELADSADAGVDPAVEPEKYQPCTLRTQIGRIGRLPLAECLEIASTLAQAIAALHQVGLVHRDVKPSNIIFVSGRAKLADIGLVGDVSESRSYVGTEGYVPPEGPGRPGADLYGLGRVIYEMATGYEATRFPALPPDWLVSGNRDAFEFFDIVLRCCEPNQERRYQTAEALIADLALLQSGQSIRQVRQMRGMIAFLKKAVLVTVVIGLVGLVGAWWQGKETEKQRKLVQRAEQAEAEARRNLFDGLLQQARNARKGGDPDARFVALDLLKKAVALQPGTPEMREEFIATLATPGLRLADEFFRSQTVYGTVAADPSLTHFFICHRDGTMELQRGAAGKTVRSWKGKKGMIPVGVSSDGHRCFSTMPGGPLVAWEADSPTPTETQAAGTGDTLWSVNADGNLALCRRGDGTLSIPQQNLTWQCPLTYRAGYDPPPAIDPEFRLAVIASAEQTKLYVYRLKDGSLLHELNAPLAISSAVAISADGDTVAAGFMDGGVGVWRLNGTKTCEILPAGLNYISGLAVSPDGRFLVSTTWSSATHLWDLADATRLTRSSLPGGMPRFSASGDKLQIDSALILRTYDFDPGAVCRSVILPRQAMAIQQPTVNKFALHPESPYLIVPSDGGLMLVDTIRTATTKRWPIHAHDVAFNTTGTHLIIGGRTITRVPISKNAAGQWIAGLPGLVAMNPADDPVVYLQSSADAETIVGWHAKGSWSVFQPGKGARSLGSTMGASQSFSVGPEGKSMIHGTVNQGCRVLDLQTGQPSAQIAGQGDWPQCTFTPDRKGLVVSDAIGIRMLQADTWKPIWQNNQGARSTIGSFAWMDPAGTYVIHAPQAGILTLLDSATGHEALTLRRERETSAHFVALTADLSQLWQLDAVSQVLWRWDLGALRRYLRPLGLDWSTTPLPPVPPTEAPPLQGWLNMLPEKPE